MGFWGPAYPDAAGGYFWDGAYPDSGDAPDLALIPGNGPPGVATLVLSMQSGFTVTYQWETTVFKSYSGLEKRASNYPDPIQSYKGDAFLVGEDIADHRALLARYAAAGSIFQLGLPHEAIELAADSDGTTCFVWTLANTTWANPGQRVVVKSDEETREAVIQSVSGTEIELDIAPGSAALEGGIMMPTMAVVFDPQQGFGRYAPTDDPEEGTEAVEKWQIDAHAVSPGFLVSALPAKILLEPPRTNSGALETVVFQAREAGSAGNAITIRFSDDALAGVEFHEDVTAKTIHFKFVGSETTVQEMIDVFNTSELVFPIGAYNALDLLVSGDDEFLATAMSGGSDEEVVDFGAGAELATYRSAPVWDRSLIVDGTSTESIQAMTEIVELGALPVIFGEARVPDWGRALLARDSEESERQWVNAFLFAAKGSQRTFWVPTLRKDLEAQGNGPGGVGPTGVLLINAAYGSFATWYPLHRQHIAVRQGESWSMLKITGSAPLDSDTIQLFVEVDPDDPGAALPTADPIDTICWLDLCRFEKDSFPMTFSKGAQFELKTSIRVVPQ